MLLDRVPRPRFHLIYYVLAAFDLLAVSLGLFLVDRISAIHQQAIVENQVWAGRLADLSDLAQLAAGVNTPGNDVFQTGDVQAQRRLLDDAVAAFDTMIDGFRAEIVANVDAAEADRILPRLDETAGNMDAVVVEAARVFDAFASGSPQAAGEAMATMDQAFGRALQSMTALAGVVRAVQQGHFAVQSDRVAALRRYEFVIAALIVIMVCGVTVYGHLLARRIKEATARRAAAEAELDRYREHLEELVVERTEALEASNEQLRIVERLASIGTLAAGLGHDMNNVLFPVLCRLDVLDQDEHDETTRDELREVRRSIEYLQLLSDGLRLLAVNPDAPGQHATALGPWWRKTRPLFVTALPKHVTLTVDIPDDLPPVRATAHRLTQAVFNLVTNAGQAIEESGVVEISAARVGPGSVRIAVTDNGCGMTPEQQRRALDPFYTTKSRTLSTGLGLLLVQGLATASGGAVKIESEPGVGTTVSIRLHAAPVEEKPASGDDAALVLVEDRRIATFLSALLKSRGFAVSFTADDVSAETGVLITTDSVTGLDAAKAFRAARPAGPLVLIGGSGEAGTAWEELGAIVVPATSGLDAMREVVRAATASHPEEAA
jgi:signal transduction histidine kinase